MHNDQTTARRAPQDMPRDVPTRRPQTATPKRDVLPQQKSLTAEPEPRKPSKLKKTLKIIGMTLLVVLALALAYVFLLMGEPDEDSEYVATPAVADEVIRVPMAAVESQSTADLSTLAANFGKPVLVGYGDAVQLQNARLYDTAFEGGYARRVTLTYAFADGATLTLDSIRPVKAVKLLSGGGYSISIDTLYTLAGLDAVSMSDGSTTEVVAQSEDAVYAIRCPQGHASELSALLKQMSLMQATTPS